MCDCYNIFKMLCNTTGNYNERGQVGLFKPNGPKMEQVSSFKVTKGTKAHFSHPVVCHGVLYLRHGNCLLAYKIAEYPG